MKKMTYEEYRQKVKEHFCRYQKNLPDEEVERYLESEVDFIKESYGYYLDDESPAHAGSSYSAVGDCLDLMY